MQRRSAKLKVRQCLTDGSPVTDDPTEPAEVFPFVTPAEAVYSYLEIALIRCRFCKQKIPLPRWDNAVDVSKTGVCKGALPMQKHNFCIPPETFRSTESE